jgi:F-type H+-transporting ATPase subunit delta
MRSTKKAKREAKRLFRLCLVDGALDELRIRQVTRDIAASGDRNRLAMLSHILRLAKWHRAQHTAKIESAATLPADVQADLAAALKRRYGRELAAAFTVQPSLIGGVRIQVGSDVYDGSVRAKLAALEKSF